MRSWKVSPTLGAFALIVLIAVGANAGLGLIWGLLRPAYAATVTEDAQIQLDSSNFNVEFQAWGWLVLGSSLVAIALAFVGFFSLFRVSMLCWVGLWAWLGAWVMYLVGHIVGDVFRGVDEHLIEQTGATFSYLPVVSFGISGQLAAPFLAVLMFWVAAWIVEIPADAQKGGAPA